MLKSWLRRGKHNFLALESLPLSNFTENKLEFFSKGNWKSFLASGWDEKFRAKLFLHQVKSCNISSLSSQNQADSQIPELQSDPLSRNQNYFLIVPFIRAPGFPSVSWKGKLNWKSRNYEKDLWASPLLWDSSDYFFHNKHYNIIVHNS